MQSHDNLNLLMFGMPENKFENEAKFTTWFLGQIKKRGGFAFKISDMDPRTKPCDSIFAFNGISGLIEFKCIKHSSTVPFGHLRGSSPSNPGGQVEGLRLYARNVEKSYGKSLVCIYSQKEHSYKIFDIRDEGILHSKLDFKGKQDS